jgi:hypothetical protein
LVVEAGLFTRKSNYKTTESHEYAPDDDRSMGLQGMINDLVERSDFPTGNKLTDEVSQFKNQQPLQNCGASKA